MSAKVTTVVPKDYRDGLVSSFSSTQSLPATCQCSQRNALTANSTLISGCTPATMSNPLPSRITPSAFAPMLHWSRMLGAEQPSAARSFEIPPPWDNTPLVRRHEKYYFTDGTIVVKIDGVSFHLHRGTLERYSPKFKSLFRGLHEFTNELVVPGVNVRDFERFLSVLYPDELGVEPVRSPEEWISLLKQSHHWQVESLKRVASQHVASLDMSPAERIKLYQDCGLGDSIDLLAAFTQLCQREEAISLLEANLLGMEAYSKVVALREMIIKHQVTGHLTDEVARTFALRGLGGSDAVPPAYTSDTAIAQIKNETPIREWTGR